MRDATWVKKGVWVYVTDIELVGEDGWMDSVHQERCLGVHKRYFVGQVSALGWHRSRSV